MVRHRTLKDKDIEELLAQLESGEISEDDAESDGDDLEFYPTLEELQAALEEEEAEEELTSMAEEENLIQEPDSTMIFPDPPLLNEDTPSAGTQDPFIPINAQNLRWRKASFPFCENQVKFNGVTDYPPDVMNLQTPFQFFSHFFTPDILDKIVEETNLYSVQKQPERPASINVSDVRKYFGILIFMSVFHYPSVRSYWDTKYGFEAIKQAMPINRFEKIREIIHFNDNQQHKPMTHPQHDRLHKLRPVIDHLNEKFSCVPMQQRLSIDEQMCATKIGHFMKQYLPNKPHKWGFKLFVLCSLSGYAYRFIIYSGKDTEPMLPGEADVGVVGNTVIKLSRGIPRRVNHIVYFDNYYTSLPLMYYMAKKGILCLGTVQRNRLGKNCKLPTKPQVMARSVPRGSFDEYITTHDGVDMTAVSWKDNKQVILLSTYVGATPVGTIERYDKNEKTKKPISCPKVVREYNAHMGGVDLMDSFLGRYRIRMKTRKWYLRIFYHLLDLTVINSCVLYKEVCERNQIEQKNILKLADFRADLADTLCKYGINSHPTRGRPSNSPVHAPPPKRRNILQNMPSPDIRFDGIGHIQIKGDKRMKCRKPGCKLLSSVQCNKCKVFLCSKKNSDCFNDFHL